MKAALTNTVKAEAIPVVAAEQGSGGAKKFVGDFLRGLWSCSKRCVAFIVKSSPMTCCAQVEGLMEELNMGRRELLILWKVFVRLAQTEVSDIVESAGEIEAETIQQLVQRRRKWVSRLLRCVLRLGGCDPDTMISWDEFNFILLRFCCLTEPELCQLLFLLIAIQLDSANLHYLTKEQLTEYFSFTAQCPVKAFNTGYINFERLPLSRYYSSDLSELVTRFRQMLNPLIHLQSSLREHLPGVDFWDSLDNADNTRYIGLEFFLMKRVRVHIWGEPPFRETCDMLAPDALGAVPLNQDQWYLRVRGMKQTCVWGEQLTPEVNEAENQRIHLAKLSQAREKAVHERKVKEAMDKSLPMPAPLNLPPIPVKKGEDGPPKPTIVMPPGMEMPKKLARLLPDGKGLKAVVTLPEHKRLQVNVTGGEGRDADGDSKSPSKSISTTPQAYSEFEPLSSEEACLMCAAHLDVMEQAPSTELPPRWMWQQTVAPAPQARQADPPLWRMRQLGLPYQPAVTSRSFVGYRSSEDSSQPGDLFGQGRQTSRFGFNSANSGNGSLDGRSDRGPDSQSIFWPSPNLRATARTGSDDWPV